MLFSYRKIICCRTKKFEGQISTFGSIKRCITEEKSVNPLAVPPPMESVASQQYIHGYLRSLTLSGIDIF